MTTAFHAASKRDAPARSGRWRRRAPVQRRGHETMDLFAEAAEELLREKPFEAISVQDIVRHAGRPIGSFYARFASKDALLPFLYERYHDGLESTVAASMAQTRWERLEFEESVAATIDFLLGLYEDRRWLIRALALFTRTRPESLPPDLVRRRKRVYDQVVEVLIRHRARIAHPDAEAAIRFGVFMVSSVAREKLLFADAPHSRVTPITRRRLREELVRALFGYLTAEVSR